MRFFFHLHNDIETVDDEGIELPDEAAARRHAERVARIMAAESVKNGHLDLTHYLDATDEKGNLRFRTCFRDVVEIRP